MFTGIIKDVGEIQSIDDAKFTISLSNPEIKEKIKQGASISLNGTCFTVTAFTDSNFTVEAIPETLYRTSFGKAQVGSKVNLEACLGPTDTFEGHIVQGHIDGTAVVKSIEEEGNMYIFSFTISEELSKYIVSKGSIAVDGISLTVIEAEEECFTVGIIPYTWDHTNFSSLKAGDEVNIEVDVIAKYVEKLVNKE